MEVLSMYVLWGILIAIFVIFEALTPQLTTIWLAAGAIVALVADILGAQTWLQVVLFLTVSVLLIALTRPIVKKFVQHHKEPTNLDRLIGSKAIVIEDINNILNIGRVQIKGLSWSAISQDGSIINEDEIVVIHSIQGAKLIVSRYQKDL